VQVVENMKKDFTSCALLQIEAPRTGAWNKLEALMRPGLATGQWLCTA